MKDADKPPTAPVTDAHFAAIGRMIVAWSVFEMTLRFCAYALAVDGPVFGEGVDHTVKVVFEGMATRTLVGIIQSLVSLRHPKDAADVEALGVQIMKAKRQRDIIGHSPFIEGKGEARIRPLHVRTVGGLRRAQGEFSADDILAWAAEISRLSITVSAAMIKWGYVPAPPLPASPDTPDARDQP